MPLDRTEHRHPVTRQYLSAHTDDRKREIIKEVQDLILDGKTMAECAQECGIPLSTLKLWIHSLGGDEYKSIRTAWLDGMLIAAQDAIDSQESLDHPLALARAREQWRYATWYAERRDPARYGTTQQLQPSALPTLTIIMSNDNKQLATAERVIDSLDVSTHTQDNRNAFTVEK